MATTAAAPAALELSVLEGDFGGEVLTPGSPGYDAARHNFQGLYDRRPAVIAQCDGVADVMAALSFARESGLGRSAAAATACMATRAVMAGS
jgi:hypothetical protein